MSVHVVDRALIVCDRSSHHAKSVGQGGWVVSFLPGRTLTTVQATAAIQVAEAAAEVENLAMLIGLTAREAFGLACAMRSDTRPPVVGETSSSSPCGRTRLPRDRSLTSAVEVAGDR